MTLSRDARARAVQLPAWNEALGLPRPWDQQWSLRIQQVLAYESDLLEYPDLFAGSHVVEALTTSIMDGARAELDRVLEMGGVVAAVESGYLKSALVASLAQRRRRVESGDEVVVGVNRFAETEPSPLAGAGAAPVELVDPQVESDAVEAVKIWREQRDAAEVAGGTGPTCVRSPASRDNLMPATLRCVQAGVTTGEWAGVLRQVFGEYRAPTGLGGGAGSSAADGASAVGLSLAEVRERVRATAAETGAARLRLLVGKPGLDGHSNGAEQIAVRARDAGFEVIYQGIRLTPEEIVSAAVEEGVDLVGLSVLSGSHLRAVADVLSGLKAAGVDIPVVVGGIIPAEDERTCGRRAWPGCSRPRTSS